MKKLILLLLVLALSACTSATEVPSAAPTDVPPTSTPVVVVQTVVVEATQAPTEIPPTPVPTEVPPTAAPVVVTVVVEPTQAAVVATQPPAQQPASTGLTTVDNVLGAGYFSDMTRNSSQLSLRCQLYKEIKFSVKPIVNTITQVQFYYRIIDRSTGTAFEWQNFGKMIGETDGTFSLTFNGEQVNADSRRPNAWLDYQFVGLSSTGGVVGRSDKIEKQITYTFECPQ